MFTNLNYSGNHRMNRDEFEKAYADKYTAGDVLPVFWNRDGEGYTDHHIDLCWKVQQIQNDIFDGGRNIYSQLENLEW